MEITNSDNAGRNAKNAKANTVMKYQLRGYRSIGRPRKRRMEM
jgi:hypothetical protein